MSYKEPPTPFVEWENHINPYYTERHQRWRELCRKWVEAEILPNINKWEKNWDIPREVYNKAYEYGVYSARYPKEYGGTPFEGEPWDNFMNIIFIEQLARAGAGGIFSSLFIHSIAIPPVIHFGNEEQKKLFKPVIEAKKLAALAISEPGYGSDVANISCTAVRQGDHYIVNGEKKWISGGMKSDYFVTAVRTGKPEDGGKGISLLIIPRTEGVITSRITTQGHHSSNTALIIFKNVKVPVSYRLGKENAGFRMIMLNFNQERFGIAAQAVCMARVCLTDAVDYAKQRKTFGKPLIKHQVIRHKISEMGRQILASYNWMEKLAYQMNQDPIGEKDLNIGASVALFKVQATKTFEFVAREASQILGGPSYVDGKRIERSYRDVRAFSIYGGSEEIMLDVATRLAKL